VEYTKLAGGSKIATVHCGADFMLRNAYMPDKWQHRVSVYSPLCEKKPAQSSKKIVIAGPLCFSGDVISTTDNNALPDIEPNDYVVVHDVGAYTLSMWSRYNSRPAPAVYGYSISQDTCQFVVLKPREDVQQVLAFWGHASL